jgi:ABC transporter DrrB family efflux protein
MTAAAGTIARWPGRASALIAERQLRVLRLNPGRLIYPLVQPVVLLVLFVSVLGNLALAHHGAAGAYRQFLIPGIFLQNAALTGPSTGLGILRDAGSGLADRFRSLPMSRSAVLVGRLAGDAVVFAVQAVLLLAVAYLLGFRMRTGLPGMAATVLVTVSFGIAVAVASAWLALLIGDAEAAERVLFFPAIAITFLSSAFAPASDLASWIRPIARVSPVSAGADLIRSLAAGGPAAGPLILLSCWVALLVLIPGALAVRRWQTPD